MLMPPPSLVAAQSRQNERESLMKVHELNVTASPDRKRVGRGIGSGYGKPPVVVPKVKIHAPAAAFESDLRVVKIP